MDIERLELAMRDGWQLKVERVEKTDLLCGWLCSEHERNGVGEVYAKTLVGVLATLNKVLVAIDEAELAEGEGVEL